MKADRSAGDVALGLLGIGMFLALWQIIGVYRLAGLTWPPLTDVIDTLTDPNRTGVFLRGAKSTFSSAAIGFALGTVLGLAVATGVHLAPPLRLGVDRLASVVNALPGIALGPILIVTLGPAAAPVALATISVFFLTYVAARAGLAAAAQANQDLFTVLGARRARRLLRLELPAALPTIASGARLSLGAAMIGAVLGEWFGAPHGLGLIVIGAMQNFQISLLMVRGSLDRSSLDRGLRSRNRAGSRRLPDFRPMTRALSQSWGILLLLAAWQAWVTATGFNSIVMPSPRMVFDDLAGNPMAYLAPALATLLVAFVGAACGFAVGVAMALASWMSRVRRRPHLAARTDLQLDPGRLPYPNSCPRPRLWRADRGRDRGCAHLLPGLRLHLGRIAGDAPHDIRAVQRVRRAALDRAPPLGPAGRGAQHDDRAAHQRSPVDHRRHDRRVPDGRDRARPPVCGHAPEFADGSRGRRRPGGCGDLRLVLRTDRHRRGAGARPLELNSKPTGALPFIVFLGGGTHVGYTTQRTRRFRAVSPWDRP